MKKKEPVSTTANPVTQVAEAAVKTASANSSGLFADAKLCDNTTAPRIIKLTKLVTSKACGLSLL